MATKETLSDLHIKILPQGAEKILTLLEEHAEQVETISFVLENIPLLIIGRHGMIARIPQNKVMQKFAQPNDILTALRDFFHQSGMLYLFINLPNLPVPAFVSELIDELSAKMTMIEEIRRNIDDALDRRDYQAFLEWSQALHSLDEEYSEPHRCG